MRYGEWITEAGRVLVRNAYVWILAVPWLLLMWAIRVLGGMSVVGIQPRLMRVMNDPLIQRQLMGADTPWEFATAIANIYARIMGIGLPAILVAFALNVLAWIASFVIAGAVIHQAMPGHAERPRWQESLHVGLNRSVHLLLIRLILLLPILLLVSAFFIIMMIFGLSAPFATRPDAMAGAMIALMLLGICLFVPLLLLWGIFIGLFEPLAVQACVQEARGAWAALVRAWDVFWVRLGPVVVLGFIVFVIRMFVGAFGGFTQPLMMLMQNATGLTAVLMVGIWGMWGLVLSALNLATTMFAWIVYARAWPDLRT